MQENKEKKMCGFSLPHYFGAVPIDSHANMAAALYAGGERQLPELGLLHPDVPVAVQPPATEVLRPARSGDKMNQSSRKH